MTHNISEIMRSIALLDDPSGAFRAVRPRLYAFNCEKCHLAGDSQMRAMGNLKLPVRHLKYYSQFSRSGEENLLAEENIC
jgi:hypothetical protein